MISSSKGTLSIVDRVRVDVVVVLGIFEQVLEVGTEDEAHARPVRSGIVDAFVPVDGALETLLDQVIDVTEVVGNVVRKLPDIGHSTNVAAQSFRVLEETEEAGEDDGIGTSEDLVSRLTSLRVQLSVILILDELELAGDGRDVTLAVRQVTRNSTDSRILGLEGKDASKLEPVNSLVEFAQLAVRLDLTGILELVSSSHDSGMRVRLVIVVTVGTHDSLEGRRGFFLLIEALNVLLHFLLSSFHEGSFV